MVEDVTSLIRELGLTLEAVMPTDGSSFVGRVSDGERRLVLKVIGKRGTDEMRVLDAWTRSGVGPRWFQPVKNDAYLYEWIEGVTLAAGPAPALLEAVGQQLRSLHEVPIPAGLKSLSGRISPKAVEEGWKRTLKSAWLRRAVSLAESLHEQLEHQPVLLHGDVVAANIVVSHGRPTLIDPVGYCGAAAWDLAQLSVALVGTERRENLRHLVRGYGVSPPLMNEFFGWMTFMFLEKNLVLEKDRPGSRRQFIQELSAVADTL